jgi:hypothetical protein
MLIEIIHISIMLLFDQHIILSGIQHGFCQSRSCESQFIQDMTKGLGNNVEIDVVLLDFSLAFDEVPSHQLTRKLQHYRVGGRTLSGRDRAFPI